MAAESLKDLYRQLDPDAGDVFVVPLIRHTHKQSDYLFLLYEELISAEEYEVHSISVYDHFKLVQQAWKKDHLILHYHWLEFQDFRSMLAMPWKLLCIFLFSKLGGRLVWTVHNEFPHDRRYFTLNALMRRKIASLADALHVHCIKAVEIMKPVLQVPEDKFHVIPHPSFPMIRMRRNKAIKELNNVYGCNIRKEHPILLMFGNISAYKQIREVADVITQLDEEVTLVIAGPVKKRHEALYEELRLLSSQHERICMIPEFIREQHVPAFYNAADICVFNYREILSSGGAALALSYEKPVIAPDKGCLSELANHPDVTLFTPSDDLKQILADGVRALTNG